jgi:hypothetical protein
MMLLGTALSLYADKSRRLAAASGDEALNSILPPWSAARKST